MQKQYLELNWVHNVAVYIKGKRMPTFCKLWDSLHKIDLQGASFPQKR